MYVYLSFLTIKSQEKQNTASEERRFAHIQTVFWMTLSFFFSVVEAGIHNLRCGHVY